MHVYTHTHTHSRARAHTHTHTHCHRHEDLSGKADHKSKVQLKRALKVRVGELKKTR